MTTTTDTSRQVTIKWHTAVEALRAFEMLKQDKSSYIHNLMTDDTQAVILAIKDLRVAIEGGK